MVGIGGSVGRSTAKDGGNAGRVGSDGRGSGGIGIGIGGSAGNGRAMFNDGGKVGIKGRLGSGSGGMRLGSSKLQLLKDPSMFEHRQR